MVQFLERNGFTCNIRPHNYKLCGLYFAYYSANKCGGGANRIINGIHYDYVCCDVDWSGAETGIALKMNLNRTVDLTKKADKIYKDLKDHLEELQVERTASWDSLITSNKDLKDNLVGFKEGFKTYCWDSLITNNKPLLN
ncbi:MAG: hypothetical protein ACW98D_20090, partial [Promethearchaeota archaeon]